MSYYDNTNYDSRNSGMSDETKQFLIVFFTIFGVSHAIGILRGIIKYGTFCSPKDPSANEVSVSTLTQTNNNQTMGEEFEMQTFGGGGFNQDILNLANGLTSELNKAQFNRGPLNTNQMNMGMGMNMKMNNNMTLNYDQPPQYQENSNNFGGEMFVGQSNDFNQMNMNNMNMNMGNMNQTNNSQNEEMSKIIDVLEKEISNLGQNQQTSQLMNLVENLRLVDNITKEDILNLAKEITSIAQTRNNNNQGNEKLVLTRTTTQNTTQATPTEAFDPASLFMQYLFTFIPKFFIRMLTLLHTSALFVATIVTWAFSIVEVLIDTAIRILFYVCSPAEVRNKSSQIIVDKITYVFLNFVTIVQLTLILYFPLFTWFWKNNGNSKQITFSQVTPQNGLCEKKWEAKPVLGKASSTFALLLAVLLSYGFGAF
ncbi:hypothetical protein M0812_15317 [Anaeramoeba flamelloides]|uniref:Uncharacterized protein n=1 Tax=Anaeramoeba flamelloides TaxID=1746091 RepID=A0AAV7ZGA7_9EUKA|nr:hypothetical protein M0812_15317 [Anaeramoeba flamelloides]